MHCEREVGTVGSVASRAPGACGGVYASEVSCIDMKAKLSDNYGGEEMECAPCAPPKGQVCEDCEQKRPSWNVPGAAGKKYRWCAECGHKHAGAVSVYRRSCAEEYKTLRGELMAGAGDDSGQCECTREGCRHCGDSVNRRSSR